jgi:hypothetical protein
MNSVAVFLAMPSELAILSPEQARNALALIAEGEIGVREAGGNNCGPMIRQYQLATWLAPDPWPWCAAFVDWCIQQWLLSPSVCKTLKVADAALWRPHTAGAFDLINWAKKHNLEVVSENFPCRRGDIVVYDFSHVGIALLDSERGELTVVEGNTNGRGERDSESGDGVWKKHRERSLAKAFIRLC